MQMAGFQDMGFLVISSEDTKGAKDYIGSQINIMTYEDITGLMGGDLRNILSQKIPDYQYIFTALSNPNIFFLNEISRMCTIFNIPMLSVSIKDNNSRFKYTYRNYNCCNRGSILLLYIYKKIGIE